MYIKRFNEFSLSKEGKEFGQQRKSLDSKNRRLEDLIETLKDPSDVYEYIIRSISVVLKKLTKKDIEKLQAAEVKVWLMQERLVT